MHPTAPSRIRATLVAIERNSWSRSVGMSGRDRRNAHLKGRAPLLIINAAELRTGSAFYFTARDSGSWRRGRLALTDSGVYDNLGLAPLWPDREPSVSLNVEAVDTIICCRAGYGLRHDPPNQFMIARLKSAFFTIHDRAQNAAAKRLFDLKASGKLAAVVMPYLGQDDSRLKFRPADLVTREDVYAYPTDFSAMRPERIERLSRRGEQLTRALIAEHAPHLLASGSAAAPGAVTPPASQSSA